MGVWSTPFNTLGNAKRFVEKMQSPWPVTREDAESPLDADGAYGLVGCDLFFDFIADNLSEGDDIRPYVFAHVSQWVNNDLESFFSCDPAALALVDAELDRLGKEHPDWEKVSTDG